MGLGIDILSLYPEYFKSPLFEVGMVKRAIVKGLIDIRSIDIRSFSLDRHNKVDDRPFGGGPGMVMAPQPLFDAIRSVKRKSSHVIYLSAQGGLLSAAKCQELSRKEHLVLVCGHYEGIDQRVIEMEVDEEISIGNYVLSCGCPAALVLIDALMRFIPGALGNAEGALDDSFQDGLLEGPQYTRPEEYEGLKVPEVLLNGDHGKIKKWRRERGLDKTKSERADLYEEFIQKKE